MYKICLILAFFSVSVCNADQKYWTSIQSFLCFDGNGYRLQLSDEKLSLIETQCKISRGEDGPISTCAGKKLETNRDLLEAFCNSNTFQCIQNKPLLTDSELQSAESPEQLKEQFVGCIENVIKYNHYLFDNKINFN